MIELGQYALDGQLRGFLNQPWLQAYNGVEGIALAYDERLTTDAIRVATGMLPREWRGTVEHSRYVAMLLASAAERLEGSAGRYILDDGFFQHFGERLSDWWRWYSRRSEEGKRSPIVVEVTAGKGFGRETRPDTASSREYPYRYKIRRSEGALLQAAAAGGRIDNQQTRFRRGTTGGFLVDNFTGEHWCVTAAHVCGDAFASARALPFPKAIPVLRRGAARLLSTLKKSEYGAEDCTPYWASWPDQVLMPQCTLARHPTRPD